MPVKTTNKAIPKKTSSRVTKSSQSLAAPVIVNKSVLHIDHDLPMFMIILVAFLGLVLVGAAFIMLRPDGRQLMAEANATPNLEPIYETHQVINRNLKCNHDPLITIPGCDN